jgi:hypothetical protein
MAARIHSPRETPALVCGVSPQCLTGPEESRQDAELVLTGPPFSWGVLSLAWGSSVSESMHERAKVGDSPCRSSGIEAEGVIEVEADETVC